MRTRGKGETIRLITGDSPLGRLLVARTALGLCAVALADTEDDLRTELRSRYPEAMLADAPDLLQADWHAVLEVLARDAAPGALPWDLDCSPFQTRAWRAMQAIPRGATLTYGALAVQLGMPGGQVAVGQACARNPLALVIPCHRVLAHGNRPHHWRWGLERKVQLLAMEQRNGIDDHQDEADPQGTLFR